MRTPQPPPPPPDLPSPESFRPSCFSPGPSSVSSAADAEVSGTDTELISSAVAADVDNRDIVHGKKSPVREGEKKGVWCH